MKPFLVACILLLFLSCRNKLDNKIQTIRLTYISWGCDCANWIEPDTAKKYENAGGDILAQHCIFIEPGNKALQLPGALTHNNELIEFTGRFYTNKGLPDGYKSIEPVDKARVFRYTAYSVIKSGRGNNNNNN